MASDTKPGFFKLPAELRNHIYELVFTDTHAVFNNTARGRDFRPFCSESIGILLANRQPYSETIHYFYSLTTFRGQWRALVTFIGNRPRALESWIADVKIDKSQLFETEFQHDHPGLNSAFNAQQTLFRAKNYLQLRSRSMPERALFPVEFYTYPMEDYGTHWTEEPWQTLVESTSVPEDR